MISRKRDNGKFSRQGNRGKDLSRGKEKKEVEFNVIREDESERRIKMERKRTREKPKASLIIIRTFEQKRDRVAQL